MERDFNKELQNFKAVWARVSGETPPNNHSEKQSGVGSISLMPRKAGKSRSKRFGPPR